MAVDLERHERLKYELRLAGSSLADIARSLQVSQSTVTTVCQGYRRSQRIERAIADQLGAKVENVFSDRYPTSQGEDLS